MILILNDTAHCRENETSAAASPFECPREFIKSTGFSPRSPIRIHAAAQVRKNIQGQKSSLPNTMSYQYLCSASHIMTRRPPKYLEWYFIMQLLLAKLLNGMKTETAAFQL